MKHLALGVFMILSLAAFAKNRDPRDYPQRARVVSFRRDSCISHKNVVRTCHFIIFRLDDQDTFEASCWHCDPLLPGETYPARLDRRELVLYLIHQKSNGSWGQDNYAITHMEESEPR